MILEVKMKIELNTDSVIVTSVTPREHSKTTHTKGNSFKVIFG